MPWVDRNNSPLKGWSKCLWGLQNDHLSPFCSWAHDAMRWAHGTQSFIFEDLWVVVVFLCHRFCFCSWEFSILRLFISHTYCCFVKPEKGLVGKKMCIGSDFPLGKVNAGLTRLSFHWAVNQCCLGLCLSFWRLVRLKYIFKFNWDEKGW